MEDELNILLNGRPSQSFSNGRQPHKKNAAETNQNENNGCGFGPGDLV
jgi:hypothetical protein